MIPALWQIPFVTAVIALMVIVLVTDRFKASLVFLFTVALLLLGGSIEIKDFIGGISNTSILTIFTLIVITAGINDHVDLGGFFDRLFGRAGTQRSFILRMGVSVSAISSVMNNTPVVAMMMPYVYQWGKKYHINPSRLLLPLSYSAIAGGMITLIGTSTNLVLNGLLTEKGIAPLGFGDFFLPGLLVTAGTLVFMYIFGPWLTREHKDILTSLEENVRHYVVESRVQPNSILVGQTVEEAGLRNLDNVFLTEIIRGNERLLPVKPTARLQGNDILLFAGDTSSTLELIDRKPGLEISKQSKFNLGDNAEIIEAIVTQNSLLDRATAKDVSFREQYDAAIIGIHRQGEKISGKIGTTPFRAGDLLLLMAGPEFRDRFKRSNDFLLINTLEPKRDLSMSKLGWFLFALALSLGLMISGLVSLFPGLLLILLAQVLLGMINLEKIKQNISFDLLTILISALAIGHAFIDTGAAAHLTNSFFHNAHQWGAVAVLCGVFLSTFILTSLITNVAAVTIIFPIVYTLSGSTVVPDQALYLTAAFGASCCFATPFAYQTNLMVMEAGHYKFVDFLRFGVPVSIVYAAVFLIFALFKFQLL